MPNLKKSMPLARPCFSDGVRSSSTLGGCLGTTRKLTDRLCGTISGWQVSACLPSCMKSESVKKRIAYHEELLSIKDGQLLPPSQQKLSVGTYLCS